VRFIGGWEAAVPLIAAAFVAAGLATLVLTPLVRRIAHRYGILDRPDPRRVNIAPIPRGGGLAIMGGFLAVVIGATLVNDRLGLIAMPDSIGAAELTALLGGGFVAAVMGAADDYFQLRARWQGLGQLLLAVGVVFLGLTVDFVQNPVGPGQLLLLGFAGAFTVFWILGMVNSINWIDGLDGLSSGVGFVAAVTLGVISLTTQVGQPYVAVLCFALAGALLGFLRWNFHPASIFMGTSGTMFVGFTLAILSILGTAKVAAAILVLGVPIIDTFWIIVRRVASGRSPFTPDRGHIHHRLLDIGLSHTATVLLIYGLCLGLALLSLVLSGAAQLYAFALFVVAAGFILLALTKRTGGIPVSPAERRRGAHQLVVPDPRPANRDATAGPVPAKAPPST
jgi:UDP-GlcNAc:undecaprenyl-phosphate GlcNAc-1-phosphate transferase